VSAELDPEECTLRLHAGRSLIALAGALAAALLAWSGPELAPAHASGPDETFSPQSLVWPTAKDGYLLGGVGCGSASCRAEVRATHDGGQTWTAGGPMHHDLAKSGEPGLTSVQFADKRFGWAYDPLLEATQDGGRTWTDVPPPGGSTMVLSLLASPDGTYAVTSHCTIGTGVCDDRPLEVWRAPAGQITGWQRVDIPVAATEHVNFALGGSTVYALVSATPGPGRLFALSRGTVQATNPVTCADQDEAGMTDLAANGENRVFVLCMSFYGRGHSIKTVMVSGNGGKTFRYDVVPGGLSPGLTGHLVVAPDGAAMISTLTASVVYDRPALSKSWRVADNWLVKSEHIHDLVLQSDSTAWLIESDAAYHPDTRLWVTHDAGATWQQATVPSA
jgi:photosystem II stability/assembly factor-like uncharacterized protein